MTPAANPGHPYAATMVLVLLIISYEELSIRGLVKPLLRHNSEERRTVAWTPVFESRVTHNNQSSKNKHSWPLQQF
jgi:hypothetical protein